MPPDAGGQAQRRNEPLREHVASAGSQLQRLLYRSMISSIASRQTWQKSLSRSNIMQVICGR
jgi:hypothetical protein